MRLTEWDRHVLAGVEGLARAFEAASIPTVLVVEPWVKRRYLGYQALFADPYQLQAHLKQTASHVVILNARVKEFLAAVWTDGCS